MNKYNNKRICIALEGVLITPEGDPVESNIELANSLHDLGFKIIISIDYNYQNIDYKAMDNMLIEKQEYIKSLGIKFHEIDLVNNYDLIINPHTITEDRLDLEEIKKLF
jgi:hypothetical protein